MVELLEKEISYSVYLKTPKGIEDIIIGEKDILRVHHIITGKKFSKRSSKFGCSVLITKDNKNINFGKFERLCLDAWFLKKEEDDKCRK